MKRNQYPDKEEVFEYYINQQHTVAECMDHFGVSKIKFYTCLKKYDIKRTQEQKSQVYKNAQNNPINKNKIKETNLKKYGYANKNQADSIVKFINDEIFTIHGKEYTVSWLKEKYINENMFSQDLAKEMNIGIHLLNNICKHYQIYKGSAKRYENIRKNTLEKYGVITSLQLDSVKQKSKETCLKKYGVDNCMKNPEIKEKIIKNNLSKYGASNPIQKNIYHIDQWASKENLEKYLKSLNKKPTVYNISEYFNVCVSGVRKHIHNFGFDDLVIFKPHKSHYEDDIVNFLKQINITNIVCNNFTLLSPFEIDIYLPDYKIGIEFNGDYWHSDIFNNDHNGRSTCHQEKSLLAESKGIFLFHIFEYEWNNSIIRESIKNRLSSLLNKNKTRIPAKKCIIKEVSKKDKKEFLNKNHIQGNDHSSLQYGLYYNDELVSCMTFVKPKNKKYTWELSRFCNKHNSIIQGGASKLFKHFVDNLEKGDTISSYNDITKTKGDLYKILGFECVSINQPNYVWINFKTDDIRTRYQEQAGGEVERMHNLNYHRICDCGTKTWVYTK